MTSQGKKLLQKDLAFEWFLDNLKCELAQNRKQLLFMANCNDCNAEITEDDYFFNEGLCEKCRRKNLQLQKEFCQNKPVQHPTAQPVARCNDCGASMSEEDYVFNEGLCEKCLKENWDLQKEMNASE